MQLMTIQAVKESWMLTNSRTTNDTPTCHDLYPFLPADFTNRWFTNGRPVCPEGGAYNLGRVGVPPTCSIGELDILTRGSHCLPTNQTGAALRTIAFARRPPPCPGGTIENSPTFQRWVERANQTKSRKGRLKGGFDSVPKITLVVFDPMLLEQGQEFLLKSHSPMMLGLALNVLNDFIQLRHAGPKGPILNLPLEALMLREGIMHPFR